jgi:cell division protein FtsN
MKIAGYIGDLLYEYECVVIPGLGGFLTRDHAASVHPVRHYLKPPFREIVFNPLLRTNDGLLLSHIARSEKLSYQEAKGKLDRFVLKCIAMMEDGKRINFRSIGSIYYNEERNIVFQADESVNYLPESFGLTGIVSPPIKREEFRQKVETVFNRPPQHAKPEALHQAQQTATHPKPRKKMVKQQMVASPRKNHMRRQFTIIVAAMLLMLLAIGYMNKHIVQQYYRDYAAYTSILPLFYASPNEYVIKNKDRLPVEQFIIIENNELLNEGVVARPAQNNLRHEEAYKAEMGVTSIVEDSEPSAVDIESQVATQPEEINIQMIEDAMQSNEDNNIDGSGEELTTSQPSEEKSSIPENRYFIIAGAFKEKNNADNLINQLRVKGFQADFAGQTNSGLWRVCFEAFADQQTALQRLQLIKREENANAWLLEI